MRATGHATRQVHGRAHSNVVFNTIRRHASATSPGWLDPGRVVRHASRQAIGHGRVITIAGFQDVHYHLITLEPSNMRAAGHATRQVHGRARLAVVIVLRVVLPLGRLVIFTMS